MISIAHMLNVSSNFLDNYLEFESFIFYNSLRSFSEISRLSVICLRLNSAILYDERLNLMLSDEDVSSYSFQNIHFNV